MTAKTIARDASGNPTKMPGWFSWRHKTRDAHDEAVARYGGTRSERKERRRAGAAVRAANVDCDRTRAHRLLRCACNGARA